MNNYDGLFKGSNNIDETIEKKIEDLNGIFDEIEKNSSGGNNSDFYNNDFSLNDNSSYYNSTDNFQKNESSFDPLEKTGEIGNVDLETLRNYSRMLHEATDEPKEDIQNSSQTYGGRQKVLTTKPARATSEPVSNVSEDIPQIMSAFISCSILSFVTAGIGVGWLLYILMHI